MLFSSLLYLAPNNTKMPISYKLSEPKNSNNYVIIHNEKNQQIKTTESFCCMLSVIKRYRRSKCTSVLEINYLSLKEKSAYE
jgi:hypothetical protein